ncbi:hypothetical protein TNIN_211341 [Trichonephila inaurata madagascariensis]|uniref:Uncharacterized protein n=1 Tax=Trichonephila inaurata madagascariensis TaxID=2747483 RepID=A0A8X6Y0E5_9ARAC|nr:hypothetical protein TNIN_211341 [Trichonephila inaurata madagascariensis]
MDAARVSSPSVSLPPSGCSRNYTFSQARLFFNILTFLEKCQKDTHSRLPANSSKSDIPLAERFRSFMGCEEVPDPGRPLFLPGSSPAFSPLSSLSGKNPVGRDRK